jgi:serine/threonine protein kinase
LAHTKFNRRWEQAAWARFIARDTRLERIVAVKILPAHLSDNPEARQRFEREARSVSSLNHPHICVLYRVGKEDGTAYLVMEYLHMEYLQGETLGRSISLEWMDS